MQEIRVQSLGWEDLEKEMATHSSILARKIPWTEEPGSYHPWDHKESDSSYSPWDHKELDTTERLHFSLRQVK